MSLPKPSLYYTEIHEDNRRFTKKVFLTILDGCRIILAFSRNTAKCENLPAYQSTSIPAEHRNTGTPEHMNTGTQIFQMHCQICKFANIPVYQHTSRNTRTPEHRNTGTQIFQMHCQMCKFANIPVYQHTSRNTGTPEHLNT